MKKPLFLIAISLGLSFVSQAHAATAFVQACDKGSATGRNEHCTLPAANAGDIAAVYIGWQSPTSTLASVTVCGANATIVSQAANAEGGSGIAYAIIPGTGDCTVTSTLSVGTAGGIAMAVQEITGVNTSTPLDNSIGADTYQGASDVAGTNGIKTQKVTTQQSDDYIFAGVFDGAGNNPTYSAGTQTLAYKIAANGTTTDTTNQSLATEYALQATPGSLSAAFTYSGNGGHDWVGMLAFQPGSSSIAPPASAPPCVSGTVASYLGTTCSQVGNSAGTANRLVIYNWLSYFCTSTPSSICTALGVNGSNVDMNMDPQGPYTILVGHTSLWNVTAGQSVDVKITGAVYGNNENFDWPHYLPMNSTSSVGQTGDGTVETIMTVGCAPNNCLDANQGVSDILCSASSPSINCSNSVTVTPYNLYKAVMNLSSSIAPYPFTLEIKLNGGTSGSADLFSVGTHLRYSPDAPGNDTTPPVTAVTSPSNGAVVLSTVAVQASASDNLGVAEVQFYLDGVLQTTETAAPYVWNWDTTGVSNGPHTLSTEAYDEASNFGFSSNVVVTVSNTPPVTTTPITVPVSGGGTTPSTGGGGGVATSTNQTSLEELLQNLLADLESLIAQLNTQLVATFGRNLTIGSYGTDVQNLQVFLNDNGYTVSTSGAGSPGDESEYFGAKTSAALAKFQAAIDLPDTGFFGPLTRQYMEEKW